MRAEYINPFISSLTNAFRTMLGCEVRRREISVKSNHSPRHEISGVIGLSGRAVGTVVLSLSESVALKAASTLLMSEATEINDEVVDAVGELTNVVAGGAKAQLAEFQLSVSLPNVVTGRGHEVRFPSDVIPICVAFDSDWGSLAVEVGFSPTAGA